MVFRLNLFYQLSVKRLAYVYSNDEEFAKFLNDQITSEIAFATHTRPEFLSSVTQYFGSEHAISADMLQERHAEVCLNRFFLLK